MGWEKNQLIYSRVKFWKNLIKKRIVNCLSSNDLQTKYLGYLISTELDC